MKAQIALLIKSALQKLQQQGFLSSIEIPIQVGYAHDKQHGDFASNIALSLAKTAQKKPRELAEKIAANLPACDKIAKVEIAGPGFINFFLADSAYFSVVPEILQKRNNFGLSDTGKGIPVHIEFVSANPTGPLHVGHGRGAAYGATVSNLLEAVGYKVFREYYVNDAGRQMDILAVSIWLRYLEEYGSALHFPVNGYKGTYVITIAQQLKDKQGDIFRREVSDIYEDLPPDGIHDGVGDKEIYADALIARAKQLLGDDYKIIFEFGLKNILADIRNDLEEFGVPYESWFYESSLIESGALARGIEKLKQGGHLFIKDNALWFRATTFGDEKDRVVIRANGQHTYFAADIAYHLNKFDRGFKQAIDVFGSDHHGYAPRIRAFLQAAGENPEKLIILLVQFAVLYRGKEKVQMSTRGGEFVTLRELRNEVGNDAARFFYIMRKPEQHLDFDLELAKSKSNENPVYYIQYAHARICSVLRQLEVKKLTWDQEEGLKHLMLLSSEHEKNLLRQLSQYPDIILDTALNYEPHLLAHYLQEVAHGFHTYYNAYQFLVEDKNLRDARLALILAAQQVIANGLKLLGVSAPEVM